jgi:competence protein ComEC
MPRSGWLAVGAVGAALTGPLLAGSGRVALALGIVAVALLVAVLAPRARFAVLGVAVGAALVSVRLVAIPPTATASVAPAGDGPWTVVVEAIGPPRDGDQVATVRVVDPPVGPVLRLAATLPRYPEIQPGDVIAVDGRLRPRPDTGYGEYLARIGAWGTLDGDRLDLRAEADGPGRTLEARRRDAAAALATVLPEPEAGLAAGILIGLRDRVDRAVAGAFTTAGVSHVVAISGWNIAIVAAAVAAVAGRIGRRRRTVVTIAAIAAYIAFAGASPSVLRAGLMAGVVLVARETGRASRAAAALGWAAVALLVVDPGLVADAGFQLSSLATAGLIAWGSAATERIDRWTGGRAPRWLAESLGVSMAAQLATLPIVVASFGRVALIAPLVNLLIVPLVAPVMAAGLVAMLGGLLVGAGLPLALGSIAAVPAWVGLRLMIGIIDVAAGLPYASLTVEPPWDTTLAILLAGLIGAIVALRRQAGRAERSGVDGPQATGPLDRRLRLAIVGLVVVVGCVGGIAASRPPGVARLTVLDVGQGDAILIEGADGGRLLVDGGPDPDRLLVELDRRVPPWDRRLDVVVLSHPHEDHVAGLALLLSRYRVGRVLEPGMRGPGPGYAAWSTALAGPAAPASGTIAAGDRLRVDDVQLEVRWPVRGTVPSEPPDSGTGINNVSVVLLGTIGARRFLLTGDVEDGVDPSLLAAGLPSVDILKVAHHGSKTATTDAFLAAVRPRVAIASAGRGNPYGHPTRATIDRLAATGARVYRTDVDGSVTVTFEPAGPVVRRSPRRAALGPIVTASTPATTPVAPLGRAFVCAIPDAAPADPAPIPPPPAGGPALAAAGPTPGDSPPGVNGEALGYHRADDAHRHDGPACRPIAATLNGRAAALHLGRRRSRSRASRRTLRDGPGRRSGYPARALGRPP